MKKILLLAGIFLLFPNAQAQELNCRVNLDLSAIPASAREDLWGIKDEAERYLNNTRWSSEEYFDERIDCSMNIMIIEVSGQNRYVAKVVISSTRPVLSGVRLTGRATQILRAIDERWEFEYSRGRTMIQNDFTFDSFTDFFDYYALLIVGLDLESFEELKGTRLFQRALSICQQATGTGFASEWGQSSRPFSRFGLVDELTNNRYQNVRIAFTKYHTEGVDLAGTNILLAQNNILKSLEEIAKVRDMANPRSVLVRTFFDAKHGEIAEIFQSYPDRSVFDKLAAFDQSHRSTYEEARQRR